MHFVLFASFMMAVSFLQAKDASAETPELHTSSRTEDLKSILDKTYITQNQPSVLTLIAGEVMQKSQKVVDAEDLIRKFRESLTDEKVLSQFFAPYEKFSDEEIRQLREIYEHPIFVKFGKEGAEIFKTQMAALKETVHGIVQNHGRELVANSVLEVSSGNYKEAVSDAKMPVVLEVYATWCGACKSMEPVYRELSAKYKGKVRFAKVNYDAEPAIAKQYNVKLLPTFIFLKPGANTPAFTMTGGTSQADFEAQIAQYLGQ